MMQPIFSTPGASVSPDSSNLEDRNALIVPGYRLLDRAGEGGMGTVYRAMQLSLDRVVAVKVLHTTTGSTDSLPAFHRESRLLASLSHPHIVAIHDCGQHEGHCFLVTEFVSGAPLRSSIRPGQPWPIARAADVLDRVAQALVYIHDHGVLHLDLKPENVLCMPDGNIKIADFGLALARVDARQLCERGLAQGTLDYCPPEQRFGLHTDERSDLFSLAVMAYELLTGQLPGRMYLSAVQFNPRLPAAVDAVLCRALERDPEERHASVAEFNRQLQTVLRPKQHTRRRKLALALLGAALLLLPLLFLPGIKSSLDPASPAFVADPRRPGGWLVYDDPESLRWFGSLGQDEPPLVGGIALQRLQPTSLYPEGPDVPPLPEWPRPKPVMYLQSPELAVFVHPLQNPRLADWAAANWKKLIKTALRREDNLISNGDFSEPTDWRPDAPNWRRCGAPEQGNAIGIESPEDQPGNPALHLVNQNIEGQRAWVGVYQWLARTPNQPGAFVIFRFKARAQSGDGRLLAGPRIPLVFPRDDAGPVIRRLRALSTPHPMGLAREGMETREFRPLDWVQPGATWRTYVIVWDWPEYAQEHWFRNVEINFAGLGEVWIDDIEMFAWQQEATP